MRVLGLGTEGDSGAAIVDNARIIAAVNEERLCRLKLVEGFPRGAIPEVLRLASTQVSELDAVLVGGQSDMLVDELHPFEGWFAHWDHTKSLGGRVKKAAGRFSRFGRHIPLMEKAYYAAMVPSFRHRRREIRRILHEEFDIACPIHFVDHHFCHVTSTFFTSGLEDALVVSMDGGGDGKSGLFYSVRAGEFEYLHEISAYNSLGNFYAYVTHVCGFKAQKHEGKITGLAAYGEPRYLPLLKDMINLDSLHRSTENRSGLVFREAIRELERRLPEGWKREDLAASIQKQFEYVVRELVSHWAKQSGQTSVAAAGGVFANVRVNQVVSETDPVEQLFIHPGMSDGGLAVGAALAACVPGILERTMPWKPQPIQDVYLGTELTPQAIDSALETAGLRPESLSRSLEEEIAELLSDGYVVARADGRMEYGPRALGNRSILYQPTDPSVNDWLNEKLCRTEFMPFAPAIVHEHADTCFQSRNGSSHAAEFMTITFDCTPEMSESMAGVVHVDETARPQLVRREVNPGYYKIIEEFRKRTGLPGIINTSFNMHEEPIVCTASDCVEGFLAGQLDYLALGRHLIRNPRGMRRPLKGVRARRSTESAEIT
jgi:carbamoyltransferase